MFLLADYLLFWVIVLPIAFVFLTITVESGKSVLATVILIAALALMQIATDVKPVQYIIHKPIESLILAAGYIAVGVLYVWYKWWSFATDVRRAVQKELDTLDAERKQYLLTSSMYRVPGFDYVYLRNGKLLVKEYKARIFGWIFYWPASAAWTLLNDPIHRIFNFIYDRISGRLQQISDKIMGTIA